MFKTAEEKIKRINDALVGYSKHDDNAQKTIYEAMNYSLFAGGKRLRPLIMLSVCEMLGGKEKEVMPFACALEMIHTYSLIHDDLPAMDNDDLRRGKPTNHKVFGEAMAILAGDALLNKAFEIVSSHKYENAEAAIKAISVLSGCSGTEGMIGGQVIDILSEGKILPDKERINLINLKTAALIRAAGVIGAIMSGATQKEITAVEGYCTNLGIAFQLRDDILDAYGNEEELGKPIGSDDENGKNTFVSVLGDGAVKDMVKNYTKTALDALSVFGDRAKELSELADYLTDRTN